MTNFARLIAVLACAGGLAGAAVAAESGQGTDGDKATAMVRNQKGDNVGVVHIRDVGDGVLIEAELTGLPPGTHAIHIHDKGKCDPPFESAGGHFNPTSKVHGFAQLAGYHLGDLPNLHVPQSGKVTVEVFAPQVRLNDGTAQLLDADGSAIVIHEGVDDYHTDPAGASGARIACGAIETLAHVSSNK